MRLMINIWHQANDLSNEEKCQPDNQLEELSVRMYFFDGIQLLHTELHGQIALTGLIYLVK